MKNVPLLYAKSVCLKCKVPKINKLQVLRRLLPGKAHLVLVHVILNIEMGQEDMADNSVQCLVAQFHLHEGSQAHVLAVSVPQLEHVLVRGKAEQLAAEADKDGRQQLNLRAIHDILADNWRGLVIFADQHGQVAGRIRLRPAVGLAAIVSWHVGSRT